MQSSILTQIILPAALALLMFGMGLGLTKHDFIRLRLNLFPVMLGVLGQIILLPCIAFGLCLAFELPEELAIGVMILSACPGGSMSNVICYLSNANLALSVSLTAVSTCICVFTTPWIIEFAILHFSSHESVEFNLWSTSLGLVVISLFPVLLGMMSNHKWPVAAKRWEPFFKRFSLLFMLVMIVAILIKERATLVASFESMFLAALSLNVAAILTGVILGVVFSMQKRDTVTLGIEIGIQNASMAMLVAISFLKAPSFAISAGVYGITMYIGAALLLIGVKIIKHP